MPKATSAKKSAKKINSRQLLACVILAVLLIGSYVTTALLWHHQRAEISDLNQQLETTTENYFATNGGAYNPTTIIPSENAVYLPLVKLKLPATTLNETMVYMYTDAYTVPETKNVLPAQLGISTHDLSVNHFSSTKQFDCSQVVYADFVTPSYPINPSWESDGSVKLVDGRTMNIYYAPTISGCESTWNLQKIDSKAIADSLKQAVSY
jgi:hypothetical protein